MSDHKHTSPSIHDLLRQAALLHLERAVELLSIAGPIAPDSIHESRKAVKRIRAVLQLVRGDLGPRFDDWNHRLRTVNRRLSSTRDVDVCLATIQDWEETRPEWQRQVLQRFQADLMSQRLRAEEDLSVRLRDSLVEELGIVMQGMMAWRSETPDFELIRPAVRDMVRRARRMLDRLDERSRSDKIHSLRKIVKLRLYWLEFLQPIWPRGMRTEIQLVDELSSRLGKYHDLVVFAERLGNTAVEGETSAVRDRERLLKLLRCRQRKLAAQGLKLARRLFAEHPKAYTRRWKMLTEIWLSTPKAAAVEPSPTVSVRVRLR